MKSIVMGAAVNLKGLLKGTAQLGYYPPPAGGTKLISNSALTAAVGLTVGTAMNTTSDNWIKFAYKGKTLYLAKVPFRYNVGWEDLNAKGLVTGTTTVTIDGKVYKVRCISGTTNLANMPVGDSTDNAALNGSEFNDLMYRVCAGGGFTGEDQWDNLSMADLGISVANDFGAGMICAEKQSTLYYLLRLQNGLRLAHKGTYSGSVNTRGWRPLLELVG